MSPPESASASATTTSATTAIAVSDAANGRLAVLTAFAMAACAIPVPVVPDRLIGRVRGAVAHDIVARHGLSLTSDARATLADADPSRAYALVRKAAELVTWQILKRLGPLGALHAASRGLEVYALGHLLDRYLSQVRPSGSVRIQVDEAKRVRDVIDRTLSRALSPSLTPAPTTVEEATEDLRDEFTRWIDRALLMGAAVPSYVERRLDAAFDAVVASTDFPHE